MRIAMISEHASPLAALGGADAGGQNVHVAALSAALARRGHDVTVYTRRDDPALPARVGASPGVEVVHVDAGPAHHIPRDELHPHMDEFGDRVARHWHKDRPDVVHAHFWMSGIAARRAVERHGAPIPVIQTFHALGVVKRRHQGRDDTSPPERIDRERELGLAADGVIATCSDEVFELRAMGVAGEHVSVAPCGVDIDLFAVDDVVKPRPGAAIRVASVGRLVPRKGVETVIQALAWLHGHYRRNVELHILGGAGDAEQTKRDAECARLLDLAASLGVADRVIVHGQVPHHRLPDALRSMDMVACMPWYEPFGIVPLEAMACRVPVVAAATGGLTDTVVDGRTGLLVPPGSVASLATAIARLADNPALRAELGRRGRERVEQKFTWERVAELTEKAYAGASARKRASASSVGALEATGSVRS
ncbi:glycosyltransferase [Demequina sp. SO4-13]|uniref:glycosyltransferase n=1 Tax=Demequina sp. SO4-13 TaxID=3401027 RepID=UPI003AF730A2